jgi:prealbumin domain-containing protein
MATRVFGPTGSRRRRRFLFVPALLVVATALFLVASASGVLTGSPSKFESGNDPTLGLGNEVVNTTGNTDWISVVTTATNTPYVHLSDAAASTSDDSFTPGQKQDTTCPSTEGHKNSPKDDFTDVASYNEQAANGDVYLYGATLRYAANGNASENIELKQGTSGLCPGSTTLLARTPGDKLLAIDYLGGGSAVQFHVLTWVATGACNVSSDTAPCWGATVTTLNQTGAEGGVSTSNFTAAQNPIGGKAVVAGQFAEFGVNLATAGIIPNNGTCSAFAQTVWESRASGSSFVSSTKDVSLENHTISNCASVSVTKAGSDGGSQAGAVFTLYTGSNTSGTVVGTCTVDSNGDCLPSFTGLNPGTYTIDETTTPVGYTADPKLPETFTLAAGEAKELSYTDVAQAGALAILKNSSKGGAVANDGAVFSYDGSSVTDNGAGDEDSAIGSVCVSGLAPGDYTVNETSPPSGYGGAPASEADQVVTVANGSNCTNNLPGAGATATFTDPPLSDIQVNFRDGGSGETSGVISCDNATGTSDTTAIGGWDTSNTVTGIEGATTVTCTITIDP